MTIRPARSDTLGAKKTMKTLVKILILGCLFARGLYAADTIVDALQKGLLEEEANQNFEAAIKAYQLVIDQSEDQRRITATAVFRLGECYRKLGKTNEAMVQYQRVLREFSEQTVLINISRQNLTALGATPMVAGSGTNVVPPVDVTSEEEEEIRRIKTMIRNSPDLINATAGETRLTPLHKAAQAGQLLVAEFLLSSGANPNAKVDSVGPVSAWKKAATPLHLAAMNGHKAMVELLLAHKADANAGDDDGSTPMYYAAKKGYRTVVQSLLDGGAEVNGGPKARDRTPLSAAVEGGHQAVAELLLAHKADVNATVGSLCSAVKVSKTMVELFLRHGAEVNGATKGGSTPLWTAVGTRDPAIVELLLQHKANPNLKTVRPNTEQTPLGYALANEDIDITTLLLERGADPNQLTWAAISKPGEPGRSFGKITPLRFAVVLENPAMVEVLLKYRADVDAYDDSAQMTALAYAANLKTTHIARLLLEHGANVNAPQANGWSPLHRAVGAGNMDMVKLLLEFKANVNAFNESGETPLDLAKKSVSNRPLLPLTPTILRSIPPRVISPGMAAGEAVPQTKPEAAPAPESIADVLRKAGANENYRRLQKLGIIRPSWNEPVGIFVKGTNTINRYSLCDFMAVFFAPGMQNQSKFVDLSLIQIRRLNPVTGAETTNFVNLDAILREGDPTKDLWLEWGDIVVIPELDHALNESWAGPKTEWREGLAKIVSCKVHLVVKGQTNTLVLKPEFADAARPPGIPRAIPGPPTANTPPEAFAGPQGSSTPKPDVILTVFNLNSVIRGSHLLRSSSDLSQVKVTRMDPSTGQRNEWIFDLQTLKPENDLRLRDQDVIEIPDKP
jgi:cytohesin